MLIFDVKTILIVYRLSDSVFFTIGTNYQYKSQYGTNGIVYVVTPNLVWLCYCCVDCDLYLVQNVRIIYYSFIDVIIVCLISGNIISSEHVLNSWL